MHTKQHSLPGITWIIDSWRKGQRPDTRSILEAHPELKDPSVILNLALEEYCLRRDAGEQVPWSTFCDQFPTVRAELRKLLDVERHWPGDEPPWPAPGDEFLEFRLLSLLGEGAAARVYLARQTTLGQRYVALKVSPFGSSEAATLGKLQHPHVVPVFSVHVEPTSRLTAVCMPYLGAATLHDVCRAAFAQGRPERADIILQAAADCEQVGEFVRGERAPAERLRSGSYVEGILHVAAELADGLAYTHAHGVLHRDLKPSNVLVTPHGRPMLLDFNLCWDRDIERTRVGGTLPYMPPEQLFVTFFDDATEIADEPRSDIYSLGVILYQLLTGRLPFPAANPTRVEEVCRHLAAKECGADDVRQWNPDVPAELAALVADCLAAELARRPRSAEQLAERLRGLLPPPPTDVSRPPTVVRRPRWALACGTTLLGGVALLGFTLPNSSLRHPVATPVVPATADSPSGEVGDGSAASSSEDVLPAGAEAFEYWRSEAQRLCAEGNYKDAETALDRAQQLRPDASLAEEFAYCAFHLSQFHQATDLLRLACDEAKDSDPDLLNNLAYCALSDPNPREGRQLARIAARTLLDQVLTINQHHPQALINRALMNLTANEGEGDNDGGVAFVTLAFAHHDNPSASMHLAAIRVLSTAIERKQVSVETTLPDLRRHVEQAVLLGASRATLTTRYLQPEQHASWLPELLAKAPDVPAVRDTSASYAPPW